MYNKFAMNLSKFKKVSGDKDHTVMEHEDGHTMKISHRALSPKMRAEISKLPMHKDAKKMAEGGEVKETFGGEKKGTKSIGDIIGYPSSTKKKSYAEGGEVIRRGKLEIEPIEQEHKLDIEEIPQKKLEIEEIKMADGGDVPQSMPIASSPQAIPPIPAQFAMSAPEEASVNPVNQMPQGAAPQPEAPQASPLMPQAPQQQDSNTPDLMHGYQQQAQGIQGQANAQAQQGKEEAGALKSQLKQVNNLMGDYQTHFQDIDNERKALIDDINKTHIDPNRYMGSMDFGSKVSTAIGLALGGLGQGLIGGQNQALDYINKQIDRDIDAQKAELGKKDTLLSANMKRFGNLKDATEMTRLMQNDIITSKLKMAEAKAQSPMAKARAQQLLGQLEQQTAPIAQQLATRRMLDQTNQTSQNGQQAQVDPASFVPSVVPESHQEAVYKELERAQNTRKAADSILKNFDAVSAKMKGGAGLGRLGTALYEPAERSALEEQIGTTVSDKVGTVREAAMKLASHAYVPNSTDTDERLAKKREELQKYLQLQSAAPRSKSFGIDIDKFGSTTRNTPEVKTLNGVQYQKAPGGWKRVK